MTLKLVRSGITGTLRTSALECVPVSNGMDNGAQGRACHTAVRYDRIYPTTKETPKRLTSQLEKLQTREMQIGNVRTNCRRCAGMAIGLQPSRAGCRSAVATRRPPLTDYTSVNRPIYCQSVTQGGWDISYGIIAGSTANHARPHCFHGGIQSNQRFTSLTETPCNPNRSVRSFYAPV